jgi:hypothetical protein
MLYWQQLLLHSQQQQHQFMATVGNLLYEKELLMLPLSCPAMFVQDGCCWCCSIGQPQCKARGITASICFSLTQALKYKRLVQLLAVAQ